MIRPFVRVFARLGLCGIALLALVVSGCQSEREDATLGAFDEVPWIDLLESNALDDFAIFGGDSSQMDRWRLDNGVLELKPRDRTAKIKSKADLVVTTEALSDFELYWEWKLSEGGNGGLFYRVREDGYDLPWHTGFEYQMLDDANNREGKIASHRAGELYDLVGYEGHAVNPASEWNASRVLAQGNRIRHWLNGVLTVDIEVGSSEWNTAYKNSKYAGLTGVGAYPDGHIVLQDHGDSVWIRELKARSLESDSADFRP